MRALYVLLAMLTLVTSASAADCSRWKVDVLLGQVPYFDRRLATAPGPARPGEVALVHKDDPGISAVFRLQAVAEPGKVTRAAYLADLTRRLELEARDRERRAGVTAETSIFPYDPVTWTFVQRMRGSTDVRGVTTIRMSDACQFVASWAASDAPSMQSRTQEFRSALDALRTFTERRVERDQFEPDVYVPKGWEALMLGAGLPLGVMIVLLGVLQASANLVQPGIWPRAMAAAIMGVALWAFQAQLPIYLDNAAQLAYLDGAMLLLIVIGSSAAAAVSGAYLSAMLSFAAAVATGLAYGVFWRIGWSPVPDVAAFLAFAFIFLGVIGLAIWQVQATAHMKRLAGRTA